MIVIRGVEYSSIDEAAKAFSVSMNTIYRAIKAKKLDSIGGYRVVTIRGVQYSSIDEAAKAFGFTKSAIYRAIRVGKLDQVGIPGYLNRKQHGATPMRVRIRGVVYDSIKIAAKELDVAEETIRCALRRGTENNIGLTKHQTSLDGSELGARG